MKYLVALLITLAAATSVAAVTYTLKDIRDAECATACRREGYTTGFFIEKGSQCACTDIYLYVDVTKKRLTLPRRGIRPESKPDEPIHLGPLKENSFF